MRKGTFCLLGGCFLSLLLLLPLSLLAQPPAAQYAEEHVMPIPYEGGMSMRNLTVLDSVVPNFSFFFLGEEHWKTINTELQLAFLVYLHQHAGVRNMIIERGYSVSFLINQYLETGDERILNKAMTNLKVCPEDQINMFKRIYEFNKGILPEDQIRVTGIDLEHSPELALQVLHTLLPEDKEPARVIAPLMKEVVRLHRSRVLDPVEVKRFFRKLNKSVEKHPDAYMTFWESDAERVQLLAANTWAGYKFGLFKATLFPDTWRKREVRMYENFLTLQPYMADGGYFAQFGVLHTDLSTSPKWDFLTLAQRLNQNETSPVASQVLTISRYVRQMEDRYQKLGESERLQRIVRHVERHYPEQVVLCSLIGAATPFPEMSRAFQYILFIDAELEKESCK